LLLPPGINKENNERFSEVKGIVQHCSDRFKGNIIIVGGDFNGYRPKMQAMLEKLHIYSSFKGQSTFKRSGNQLDDIYTNATLSKHELKDV
jgi:hypothetical protein